MATDSLPHARLSKSGDRVLCGSKQNGLYWCGGKIGALREWTPPLRAPYDESTRQVQAMGFQVSEHDENGQNVLVAVLHYLELAPGLTEQRPGLWTMSENGRSDFQRGRSPALRRGELLVDHRAMGEVIGPRAASMRPPLTPSRYPFHVECPSCRLVQKVDGKTPPLVVWNDDTDKPWWRGPAVGRNWHWWWNQLSSISSLQAIGVDIKERDETAELPDRHWLYGVAMRMVEVYADCYPSRVPSWRQLAEWSRTASDSQCTRCLRQLQAFMRPASQGDAGASNALPWFAETFLLHRDIPL